MHTLIIGSTESGKTTLAKIIASNLKKSGKSVAVLDPIFDPDWKCDYRTDDINEMRQYLEKNRSCYVFIDECGSYFNEGNDLSNAWYATRSRHYGHSVFFIAQRAVQVPTTMRYQCSRLGLFLSSKVDGKIHSGEWNQQILENCNSLERLHFYWVDRYRKCEQMRIVKYKGLASVNGRNHTDNDSHRNRSTFHRGRLGKVDASKGI